MDVPPLLVLLPRHHDRRTVIPELVLHGSSLQELPRVHDEIPLLFTLAEDPSNLYGMQNGTDPKTVFSMEDNRSAR